MTLVVRQLPPRFFGEITGADLTAEPAETYPRDMRRATICLSGPEIDATAMDAMAGEDF